MQTGPSVDTRSLSFEKIQTEPTGKKHKSLRHKGGGSMLLNRRLIIVSFGCMIALTILASGASLLNKWLPQPANSLPSAGNSPERFQLLSRALASDTTTRQAMHWSTDITHLLQ
jgi:hypothetical protein